MNFIVLVSFLSFFSLFTPSYSYYTFISSTPSGATVSIIEDGELKKIGQTPFRTTNFLESTEVVIEKARYFVQTNNIPVSTNVESYNYSLRAFSFDIQVLDLSKDSVVQANGRTYAYLDSAVTLPYGNYNFSRNKNNDLIIDYKSPYVPYIAFFSSVTIVSTILAITGGVLARQAFQELQTATNSTDIIDSINRVALWDTFTWSSVGIGTGGLIGTIITASLDARDRKRIKRFNGMNTPSRTSTYFSEYQDILLSSSQPTDETLTKISAFINKYSAEDSPLLSDVYLRRANIYMQRNNNRSALRDLNRVMNDYPSRNTYELASKLQGDIYLSGNNYLRAYESYSETYKVLQAYALDEIQELRLGALYQLAKSNNRYVNEFLQIDLSGLSPKLRSMVQGWKQEF